MQSIGLSFFPAEFKLSLALFVLIATILFQSCQKQIEIPAKAIVGTYTASRAVFFTDLSDSCTLTYDAYDSTAISMRWQISYKADNLVDVLVTAISTDTSIRRDTICQLGHQYSFPMNLRGIVGGSSIVIERSYLYADTIGVAHTAFFELGSFGVAGNILSGKLVDLQCDTVHCYGYRTGLFTLRRE